MSLIIKVKKLHEDAKVPTFGSEEALGADLYSVEDCWIAPEEVKMIASGIAIAPNMFCDIQVRPRSGLAAKNGITVLNSPGTIDPDYRGELKTILINHSKTPFHVEKGMRVAQLVALASVIDIPQVDPTVIIKGTPTGNVIDNTPPTFQPYALKTKLVRAVFVEATELTETVRGEGGFGSSGLM